MIVFLIVRIISNLMIVWLIRKMLIVVSMIHVIITMMIMMIMTMVVVVVITVLVYLSVSYHRLGAPATYIPITQGGQGDQRYFLLD